MGNRKDYRIETIALSRSFQPGIQLLENISVSTLLLLVVVKREVFVRNFSARDSTEMKVIMVVMMERYKDAGYAVKLKFLIMVESQNSR